MAETIVVPTTNNESSFKVPTPNISSGTSNLEIQKYLYNTGLQNIFSDYQKNIASLEKNKTQAIQDAYTTREISKKYLGEYASNVGVGDVSGNLLDVYSSYQKNIGAINENFATLQANYQDQYQQQRSEMFNKVLETQYQIDITKQEQNAQDLINNISRGFYYDNSGKKVTITDRNQYLESISGQLTPELYRAASQAIAQDSSDVAFNLQRGYYEDASGNRVDITNNMDYLESVKDTLSPEAYKQLYGQIYTQTTDEALSTLEQGLETGSYGTRVNEQGATVNMTAVEYVNSIKDKLSVQDYNKLIQRANAQDLEFENNQPTNVESIKLSNPFFDASYYFTGEENISSKSDVFKIGSLEYAQVLDNVDSPEEDDAPVDVTSDDLFEQNPNPVQDDVATFQGTYYVFKNGNWHRLVGQVGSQVLSSLTKTEMSGFSLPDGANKNDGFSGTSVVKVNGIDTAVAFQLVSNGSGKDVLTVNGINYTESNNNDAGNFKPESVVGIESEEGKIKQAFIDTHGSLKKSSVIYYNGSFWEYNNGGYIVKLVKK